MSNKIFPTILILMDIGAGIVYLINGDWKRFVYWVSAAVLTITVTF